MAESCSSSACSPCITLVGARGTRETCGWLESTLTTGSSPWLPPSDGLNLLELGELLGGSFTVETREEKPLNPATGLLEEVTIGHHHHNRQCTQNHNQRCLNQHPKPNYSFDNSKLKKIVFTESAHWANSVIDSQCPYACLYVCVPS